MTEREEQERREIEELMARTRKNIAEAEAVVQAAEMRIVETDRLLAANGLTREQVMNLRFTPQQRMAVNEELARMGLPPIEDDEESIDFTAATAGFREAESSVLEDSRTTDKAEDIVNERQRKFGNFMQAYRI